MERDLITDARIEKAFNEARVALPSIAAFEEMKAQRDALRARVEAIIEQWRATNRELIAYRDRVEVLEKALRRILGHMQPAEDDSCTWVDGPDGVTVTASGSLARAIRTAYAALGDTMEEEPNGRGQ